MEDSGTPNGYELVEGEARLAELVAEASTAPGYALDTEFHREQTYFPRVGLVQLAWGDRVVLLDPVTTSLKPLVQLLDSPATAIMHAPDQDLEILRQVVGRVPARLMDTQTAAGFCGLRSASLRDLLARFLDVDVAKGDRLTDWLRRPLQPEQLAYAAADVRHLPPLWAALQARLEASERLEWCEEECERLRLRQSAPRRPEDAWLRVRELRRLPRRSQPLAIAVAAWRERRAAQLDIPVRYVLSDLALAAVVQAAPDSVGALAAVRGVDGRAMSGAAGNELLEAIAQARRSPPRVPRRTKGPDRSHLQPVVALVSAWLSQVARDDDLDPALVATRADLTSFLDGEPDARLAGGWRYERYGSRVEELLAGNAAVALEPDGKLRLEKRSGRPL
ncbi:MAG: HRDC domain-containing protein [bacterium]|nr:HRDC domain-containing protein [bacterium]